MLTRTTAQGLTVP